MCSRVLRPFVRPSVHSRRPSPSSSSPPSCSTQWFQIKPAKNRFTWCDFTNFFQASSIHLISVSGHCMRVIFNICQSVSGISKNQSISRIFWISFSAGFCYSDQLCSSSSGGGGSRRGGGSGLLLQQHRSKQEEARNAWRTAAAVAAVTAAAAVYSVLA